VKRGKRRKKILVVALPPELFEKLDREAKKRSTTKSEVVRIAIRNYLNRRSVEHLMVA